ncbi:MAG TPA: DUF1501 domain-containing protein [Pirellulales bacterium]
MLTIASDRARRFYDRVSRRNFLKIGGLALGGLSLSDLLRAEAAQGKQSHKSVIMIYLPGGPPHQDMFDLKPDAPSEIRGEFKPIGTSVPGIEMCEHMPQLAGMMHRLIAIRSLVGATGDHYSFQCMTGRSHRRQPPGGWPEIGSAVARLQGSFTPALPAYVGLSPRMQHTPYNSGKPGYLGPAYAPFQPNGDGKDDLVLQGVSSERLAGRETLVRAFDRLNRRIDSSGIMEGMDAFERQAFGVLTSSRLAEALDVEKEPRALRERYGYGTEQHQGDGAPRLLQQFLMARRLVEAGVRLVTLSYSFWDFHGQNFAGAKRELPLLDQATSALVEDLYNRGLDKDVTVIVWGEFGRTPKINAAAGRDHWPNVSCALLAGGGLRAGQVIGSTDRHAAEVKDRPVHFEEVHATLYHSLGIDPLHTTIPDLAGRPQYLTDGHPPLAELA